MTEMSTRSWTATKTVRKETTKRCEKVRVKQSHLEAVGEDVGQVVEVLAQLGLQLVEHRGGVLLQLLAAHRLVRLLELDPRLLDVVHEHAGGRLVPHVVVEVPPQHAGVQLENLGVDITTTVVSK